MNITKDNVRFINQYLIKSDVVFDDLRMELVDHVATAVSFKMVCENLNFYDAFKNYMFEHKKSILKAGMVNQTFKFKKAIIIFFNFVFDKNIAIFSVIYLLLGLSNFKIYIIDNLYNFQKTLLIGITVFIIIWCIIFYGILKKRIFALENNIVLTAIYFQIVNFTSVFWKNNVEIEFYITLISGLFIVLFIAFMCRLSLSFYITNKNLYEIE